MAVIDDIKYAKPYHIAELIEQHGTGGNFEAETTTADADISTEKAAFITDMETAVNATSLSGGDKTALITAITAALNSNIDDTITATVDIQNVLQVAKDNYDALVQTSALTYPCPECSRLGQVAQYDVEGNDLGTKVESTLCNGLGYTDVQYRRHPTQSGFIPV